MTLILGSSSPYRLQLLREAGVEPTIIKPDLDENIVKNDNASKTPVFIAQILARLKSENVESKIKDLTEYIIIGSDQVCVFNNQILNKPGNFENNLNQLLKLQGQTHSLITAVCLIYKRLQDTESHQIHFYNQTDLHMKPLTADEIKIYLQEDEPFDCAGGYKFELNGRALMDKITSTDLSAIQGLPIIETLKHLEAIGYQTKLN